MLKLQVDASLQLTSFDDLHSAFVTKMRTAPHPTRRLAKPPCDKHRTKLLWRVVRVCARAEVDIRGWATVAKEFLTGAMIGSLMRVPYVQDCGENTPPCAVQRQMMKAKIFIGSSREAVSAAKIVSKCFMQKRFKGCYQVACWNDRKQGVFPPTEFGLESLMSAAHDYKFGIFVFAADDVAAIRNSIQLVARDNVVFECGMFFGRLGRHRTFQAEPLSGKWHQTWRVPGAAFRVLIGPQPTCCTLMTSFLYFGAFQLRMSPNGT